jgi:hypothetical protein
MGDMASSRAGIKGLVPLSWANKFSRRTKAEKALRVNSFNYFDEPVAVVRPRKDHICHAIDSERIGIRKTLHISSFGRYHQPYVGRCVAVQSSDTGKSVGICKALHVSSFGAYQ